MTSFEHKALRPKQAKNADLCQLRVCCYLRGKVFDDVGLRRARLRASQGLAVES